MQILLLQQRKARAHLLFSGFDHFSCMMIDFAENYLSVFVDSSSNQLFKKLQIIFLLYYVGPHFIL